MRLAVVLTLLLAINAGAGTLTITNRSYRYKAKGGELIGFYPALEDPSTPGTSSVFNNRIHQFLNDQRQELSRSQGKKARGMTLRMNYESAVTASGIVSIRFATLAEEREMAHGERQYVSIVMDMAHGRELQLKDLFRSDCAWLNELVLLTRAELEARDLPTTEEWIEEGTAPNPGNFSMFRVTDRSLEIFFPEYQVAPYASGLQRVVIPLTALKYFIRADVLPSSEGVPVAPQDSPDRIPD